MKWIEPEPTVPADEIQKAFGSSFLLAEQLTKKGFKTILQAERFLDPGKYSQTSPFDFSDIEKAANRILIAIRNNERIGIWGDFDVDGQTSTAILVDSLQKSGADIAFHIPVRAYESHGIQLNNLKHFLIQNDPQLIITCDTGISEFESIQYLNSIGVDVIITDHHSPVDSLPSVFAIINPRLLSESHPLFPLAGVGTAFQLVRAFFSLQKKELFAESYFDLVALGTIADLADLTGENRFYAKKGLAMINDKPREAFKIMAKMAGLRNVLINETQISYSFSPRLNALGRLADANPIVNFLLSCSEKEVFDLAKKLESLNTQRKLAVDMVYQSAVDQLEKKKELHNYPVIVLERENWESGVVGIAASRLVEKYNKPAIILVRQGESAAGSARSIEGINIIKAIQENSHFLIKYGGHPMAAGLSMATENISRFREGVSKSVSKMSFGLEIEKALEIDAYLPFMNINGSLLLESEQLAPFGPGNPPVVLVTRNLEIEKASFLGKSREHRKLIVKDQDGNSRNVLWWGSADSPLPDNPFDLAFHVRRDDYNAKGGISLEWLDYREPKSSIIKILPEIKRFVIHDYRSAPNQMEILEKLIKEPDTQFWAEGIDKFRLNTCNRFEINKTKTLAILIAPANRNILNEVVKRAEPEAIYLFRLLKSNDTFAQFVRRFVGMVNYCLANKAGKTNIEILGSALGHSKNTVIAGLEYLNGKGYIDFFLQEDNIQLNRVKKPAAANIKSLEENLANLLAECAAFRSYYHRVDSSYLFKDI